MKPLTQPQKKSRLFIVKHCPPLKQILVAQAFMIAEDVVMKELVVGAIVTWVDCEITISHKAPFYFIKINIYLKMI